MGLSVGQGLQSPAPANALAPNATGTSLRLDAVGTLIGWIGDSISIYSTSNAPAQYSSQTRYVDNWAVSGSRWTSGAIANQYTTHIANQTRIVAQGGINDITGGLAASAISTAVLAFVDARLAEGKQVVLNNVSPWKGASGWTASLQTTTDIYNALLASAAPSRPGMILLDLFSLWESVPGSQTLNAAYDSGDKLHPNPTGGAVWAAQMAAQAP